MPTTIEASSLKDLSAACQRLGADVRYRPEAHYFTALACNEWGASALEEATALQQAIQRKAASYPGIKCYCFDPFSTLVYQI